MAAETGLEPVTITLTGCCSTIELHGILSSPIVNMRLLARRPDRGICLDPSGLDRLRHCLVPTTTRACVEHNIPPTRPRIKPVRFEASPCSVSRRRARPFAFVVSHETSCYVRFMTTSSELVCVRKATMNFHSTQPLFYRKWGLVNPPKIMSMQIALLRCCERSVSHAAISPLGKCVILTPLLMPTCCPPGGRGDQDSIFKSSEGISITHPAR